MGDRANIYLVDDNPEHGIYLYTHWNGYEWPEMLRQALDKGRGRWGDQPYLSRILCRELFATYDQDTGGGISTFITDNQYLITVVDLTESTISWADEGKETDRAEWRHTVPFAEYVTQEQAYYPGQKDEDDE